MTISTGSIASIIAQIFAAFSSFGAVGLLLFILIAGEASKKLISIMSTLLIIAIVLWALSGTNPFSFIHIVP